VNSGTTGVGGPSTNLVRHGNGGKPLGKPTFVPKEWEEVSTRCAGWDSRWNVDAMSLFLFFA